MRHTINPRLFASTGFADESGEPYVPFAPSFARFVPDMTRVDRGWCADPRNADHITDLLDELESESPDGAYMRLLDFRRELMAAREAAKERA